MKPAEQLIRKAIEKNMKFEYFSTIERVEKDTPFGVIRFYLKGETVLGINSNEWIWTWFNVYNGDAISSHVYSQRTGKTDRSFRRRYTQENRIFK